MIWVPLSSEPNKIIKDRLRLLTGNEPLVLDPTDAPLSMFETVVQLKPPEQWPAGTTWDQLIARMNEASRTPGMAQIFWMPIQTRTEMLTTGFRSVLGIKVFGPDLKGIENVAVQIEQALMSCRSSFKI
jgi:Cu/Ag efflux pump CusA